MCHGKKDVSVSSTIPTGTVSKNRKLYTKTNEVIRKPDAVIK
jgi:hypothetical protein